MTNEIQTCTPNTCAPTAPAKQTRAFLPAADVRETEDAAHIACDVPGADPESVELRVEDDVLTLSTTPRETDSQSESPSGSLLAEWRPRRYRRSFRLGRDLDRDAIEATLEHGVLHITVPKRAEARPRTIPVRISA